MISQSELNDLIDRSRKLGAVIRTKLDASGCVSSVSIGKLPGGKFRKLGQPGSGWVPVIQAAEILRTAAAE